MENIGGVEDCFAASLRSEFACVRQAAVGTVARIIFRLWVRSGVMQTKMKCFRHTVTSEISDVSRGDGIAKDDLLNVCNSVSLP